MGTIIYPEAKLQISTQNPVNSGEWSPLEPLVTFPGIQAPAGTSASEGLNHMAVLPTATQWPIS